jgi:hypothetical protein
MSGEIKKTQEKYLSGYLISLSRLVFIIQSSVAGLGTIKVKRGKAIPVSGRGGSYG